MPRPSTHPAAQEHVLLFVRACIVQCESEDYILPKKGRSEEPTNFLSPLSQLAFFHCSHALQPYSNLAVTSTLLFGEQFSRTSLEVPTPLNRHPCFHQCPAVFCVRLLFSSQNLPPRRSPFDTFLAVFPEHVKPEDGGLCVHGITQVCTFLTRFVRISLPHAELSTNSECSKDCLLLPPSYVLLIRLFTPHDWLPAALLFPHCCTALITPSCPSNHKLFSLGVQHNFWRVQSKSSGFLSNQRSRLAHAAFTFTLHKSCHLASSCSAPNHA